MQRPEPSSEISFDNDQHRFEIVNVRRDKEMLAPEARLYVGRRVSVAGESGARATEADHGKIICKPLQTEVGSRTLLRYPEALAQSFAAVLEEHHALAD